MRFRLTAVIGRALELARVVLRDLDADQVPSSLRRVVAHAGDLTPPLAERLAREIDRFDWLREKTAASWPGADPTTDGPDRGSALFLLRPDGWATDLMKLSVESADDGQGRKARAADARDRELEVTRDKMKTAAKEAAELRRRVTELERAERAPERRRAAAEARDTDSLREASERHRRELGEIRGRLTDTEASLRAVREELREAKRDRADAVGRLDAIRHSGSWADRDPVDLAVHLDAVAAQARLRPEGAAVPGDLPPLALPKGVRPDSAAALDRVLRMPGPVGLLVDGYNVGLALGAAPPGEVRARLEDVLRRVRRLGGPGITVTVVWDSAAEPDGPRVPEGLDVRFAPPGVPADDVLVELAAAVPRAVVITNDREGRERAEAGGAPPAGGWV